MLCVGHIWNHVEQIISGCHVLLEKGVGLSTVAPLLFVSMYIVFSVVSLSLLLSMSSLIFPLIFRKTWGFVLIVIFIEIPLCNSLNITPHPF